MINNPGYYVIFKDLEIYNIIRERLSMLDEDLLAGNFCFNKLTEHDAIFMNNKKIIFSDKCLHLRGTTISVRYSKFALLELLSNPMFMLYSEDKDL